VVARDAARNKDENMSPNAARYSEIERLIVTACGIGRRDVADVLILEQGDACQDAAETVALVTRARAALLLEVLSEDFEPAPLDPIEVRRTCLGGPQGVVGFGGW
jgi:hypothetical protein